MRAIDITNERFGALVALERAGRNERRQLLWRCRCDCGAFRLVPQIELRQGKIVTCGCRIGRVYHRKVWTPERIALLGTDTDRAIAKRLGTSAEAVYSQRTRLAIPACNRTPHDVTCADCGAVFRSITQRVYCHECRRRRNNRQRALVDQRKMARRVAAALEAPPPPPFWTPERIALLGTDVDRIIAGRLGTYAAKVTLKRQALGIAAYAFKPRAAVCRRCGADFVSQKEKTELCHPCRKLVKQEKRRLRRASRRAANSSTGSPGSSPH